MTYATAVSGKMFRVPSDMAGAIVSALSRHPDHWSSETTVNVFSLRHRSGLRVWVGGGVPEVVVCRERHGQIWGACGAHADETHHGWWLIYQAACAWLKSHGLKPINGFR
jgi:hypothetical protein